MKIKNLSDSIMFCGYDEPTFELAAGAESADLPDDFACTASPRVVTVTPTVPSGSVASVSDYGSTVTGTVRVTTAAPHGLLTGQMVLLTGTTDYDGYHRITRVDATKFYITATWTQNRTGLWSGGVVTGNTVTDVSCGALNPDFVKDVIARRIEITEGRKFIRITNDTGEDGFFGYAEPSFQLDDGDTTSFSVPATFAQIPAVAADILAGTTDVAPSTNTDVVSLDLAVVQQIDIVELTLVVTDGVTAAELKANLASTDGTTQSYAVTTGAGVPVADGDPVLADYILSVTAEDAATAVDYTVVSGTSSSVAVATDDVLVVTSIVNTAPLTISVAYGTTVAQCLATLSSADYSTQVRTITNSAGVAQDGAHVMVSTDKLKVVAEDTTTIGNFVNTTDPDPDIALVAADKASLVDASIKDANPDLAHITVHLVNPLPAAGLNGSTVTWVSDTPGTVSNDGQTVNRPLFSAGDATVVFTATITKGLISDTKAFTLTVTKAAASSVATITSATYTVSAGGTPHETVSVIPIATTKADFLLAIAKGNAYQTWNDSNLSDPVATSDVFVVTAEDGVTQVVYTMAVVMTDAEMLAADKAALLAANIKGINPDLSNVTAALTDPLPDTGALYGSTITWASDTPATVSNDGQTVSRPLFSAGDATVIMTATMTKGVEVDTKAFTLTVLKQAASSDAKLTSATYTVSAGAGPSETITNVPAATSKADFRAALTQSEAHSTVDTTGVADPVVSTNTVVVTAEDGTTVITYVITVNP